MGTAQLIIYFAGRGSYNNYRVIVPLIMVYQAVFGLMIAFLNIIPNEMHAEATDYTEWTTGKRNEGVSYSLRIATTKINGTITQAFGTMMLSAIGYVTADGVARVA